MDCERAVARGAGRAERGMKGARAERGPAERDFQEAMKTELRTHGRGAGQPREKGRLASPCSNGRGAGWTRPTLLAQKAARTSPGASRGPPGTPVWRGLQLPSSRAARPPPRWPSEANARTSRRGRDARPAGTHPTATRRQRRAGRTMSASQAAANRPSGEPGPGDVGPGCSELHRQRSAEWGSCGSNRKTQPTANARNPAYAEPRHSAMGTRRPRVAACAFPGRASSGLGAPRSTRATRHAARRWPLRGRVRGPQGRGALLLRSDPGTCRP